MSDTVIVGERPSVSARAPEPPNDRPLIAGLAVAFLFAAECGAAFAAWRFHYSATLGRPSLVVPPHSRGLLAAGAVACFGLAATLTALRRGYRVAGMSAFAALMLLIASRGPTYSPMDLVRWQLLSSSNTTKRILLEAWLLAAGVALTLSFGLILAWRRRSSASRSTTTSHGSAHWGDAVALITDRGLLVGRDEADLLRLNGEGHIVTVAPTRSGKGISCVIPNLLDHPGSALITDPKGENYAVTASWRRRAGQDVHALDPFGLVGQLASYNPLDLVDITSIDAADDARMLADMLVLGEGREAGDQSFWNEEARGLLTG